MTTTPPQVQPSSLYSQKDAADLLQIHIKTLKRYAENGLIKKRYRACNGRPVYKGSDLIKVFYLTN